MIRDADLVRQIMRSGHPDFNDVQMVVPWELLEAQKRTR